MKKKILMIIVMAASHLYTLGQCEDCYEDQGISTNPTNPENCEVDEEYPNKTNQMLNSFDWAKTSVPNPPLGTTFSFNSIPLNPNAGWLIPDFTSSGVYIMESPYEQGYLSKPSGTPLADFDFAWEDGWELMYMNTGYFPNHTGANPSVYHDPNQNNNPMVPSPIGLKNPKVPYIILYNRYTGKLRTFFNVYAELGTFDDIKLDLGYLNTLATDNVSGIFRHGNGYDLPLDQQTVTKAFSTSFVNGNNVNSWFMADAQLGYDPCVCNYASEFRFKLQGLDSTRMSLYGRSISSEVPLQGADGKPTYNNWLNMNTTDAALGSDGSGALIYRSLDGMLDDYKTELEKYEENLADYNSIGNTASRTLLGFAKTGLSTGLKGLVPSSVLEDFTKKGVRIIASTFQKEKYKKAYEYAQNEFVRGTPDNMYFISDAQLKSTPAGKAEYEQMKKDAEKYSQDLATTLKGGIGSMSDALFTSFYTAPTKPVKPSMPTATLTEMKIEGSMFDLTNVDVGKLYNPGSFKFGGSFSPTSYPIYNEPVGLFALLETPKLSAYQSSSYTVDKVGDIYTLEHQNGDKFIYEPNKISRDSKISFKLKEPLRFKFNSSIDFDNTKTQIYAQIQVTYEENIPVLKYEEFGPDVSVERSDFSEQVSTNFKILHEFDEAGDGFGRKYNFTTDFYPIEMLGSLFFNYENESSYTFDRMIEWIFEEDYDWLDNSDVQFSNSQASIKKVTLKLMVDMYFLSPGFDGADKNETQVFTYLLYDKDNNIDFIEEKGEWLTDPSSIEKYSVGKITLENEVIEPTDDFVFETIGTNIYVNAEEIELKGNITVQSGYKAVLQAYWGINSDPTAELGQNIELALKRDFYNFPATVEVDNTELANYCSGTNKKYQANQAKTKRTIETPDEDEPEIDYAFTIYPNPSSDILNIETEQETGLVEILDLNGKLISIIDIIGNRGRYDVASLSAGIYFVRLQTPNGYKHLRFVKS